VEFGEHPVVNFKSKQGTLFDISAEEFPTFTPDFIKNGHFNQHQYCICLINKTFTFSSIQLLNFLRHQCSQLSIPSQWLEDFIALLKLNQNNPLIKSHQNKLELVRSLVVEKWNQVSGTNSQKSNLFLSTDFHEDKRFNIINLKEEVKAKKSLDAKRFLLRRRRTDYLQEVVADESSIFINSIDMELNFWEEAETFNHEEKRTNKIIFKKSARELVNIFRQLKGLKDKQGDLIFEGSITDYSRLVVSNFAKVGGELFAESSIRRYFSDYKSQKESNETKGLDFNPNLEKD